MSTIDKEYQEHCRKQKEYSDAEAHADRIVKEILSIPRSIRTLVAQSILCCKHRTEQQLVFSQFIGPMIEVYGQQAYDEHRYDGRNEGSVMFCHQVVEKVKADEIKMVFPYI